MKIILQAVVLGCTVLCVDGFGNPSDPHVVMGSAEFRNPSPERLEIAVGDQAIIEWGEFSIGLNESTRFLQPSASSAVLNRVFTDQPSLILGSLESNGKVILINPNGILVDKSGIVNVGAFIASTLDLLNEDFLKNSDLVFKGDSNGSIVHLGTIHASSGDVALLSRFVENKGIISAPEGTVAMAAAGEVLLALEGSEQIMIRPSLSSLAGEGTGLINEGAIEAIQAELKADGNPYSLALRHQGSVQARGVETRGGKIFIVAEGGAADIAGSIRSENGGEIHILADCITLKEGADIDASGQFGGGTILMGGAKSSLYQAKEFYADRGSKVRANAIESGNGGQVVAWATDVNSYLGAIEAKGGELSGDGGFVEVSSPGKLAFLALVDTTAPRGKIGELLLDPSQIDITGATLGVALMNCGFSASTYASTIAMGTLDVMDLQTLLMTTSTTITTYDGSCGGGGDGSITFSSSLNILAGSTGDLTLDADGDIIINAAITDMTVGGRALTLIATGDVKINENVDMVGPVAVHGPGAPTNPCEQLLVGESALAVAANLEGSTIDIAAGRVVLFTDTANTASITGHSQVTVNTTDLGGMFDGSITIQGAGSAASVLTGESVSITADGSIFMTGSTISTLADTSIISDTGSVTIAYNTANQVGGTFALDSNMSRIFIRADTGIDISGTGDFTIFSNENLAVITVNTGPGLLKIDIDGDLYLTAGAGGGPMVPALAGIAGPDAIMGNHIDIELTVNNLILTGGSGPGFMGTLGVGAFIGTRTLTGIFGGGDCTVTIVANGTDGITLNGGTADLGRAEIGTTAAFTAGDVSLSAPNGNIVLNGSLSAVTGAVASVVTNGGDLDLYAGGDIILAGGVGNNAILTTLNPPMAGTGNISAIAGDNFSLNDYSTISALGTIVLVNDNNNPAPPSIGTSIFSTAALSTITAGGGADSIQLFGTIPAQVFLLGSLNGAMFAPGPVGVDTLQEQFDVYYPDPFVNPLAPFFTIFYKGVALPVIPPSPAQIDITLAFYRTAQVALQEWLTNMQAYLEFDAFNFSESSFSFIAGAEEASKARIIRRYYTDYNLRRIDPFIEP